MAATCKTLSHLSWNISGDILLSRNTPASQLAWCKTSDLVLYGCIQIMKGVHQVVYNYRKCQTGTVAFSLWAQHSSPHTHQFQHVWTDYFGICSCLEMAPRGRPNLCKAAVLLLKSSLSSFDYLILNLVLFIITNKMLTSLD